MNVHEYHRFNFSSFLPFVHFTHASGFVSIFCIIYRNSNGIINEKFHHPPGKHDLIKQLPDAVKLTNYNANLFTKVSNEHQAFLNT